jgi:hypothetical protein
MKPYNNDYCIVTYGAYPQMHVNIHDKSASIIYDGRQLVSSGSPLFFEPSFKERNEKLGITPSKTDVMFDGSSFIVNEAVYKELKKLELQNMQLYPAVLVEDEDSWGESYWYLNIWEDLDCWDREKSVYGPIEDDWEEGDTIIDQYSLCSKVLDSIPEEKRLIFRMGGEANNYIFMHEKLVDLFKQNNYSGIRFFKVSEFEEGMQF